jgi:S-formylglutathione hydrolase FrmB
MRRWLALSVVVFAATIGWLAVRDALRGYHRTYGARVDRFTLHSRLLRRDLDEILVAPHGGGSGRFLLVLLHGRSASPDSWLSDSFFEALRALGPRAPDVLLANGGDHSYWHDRAEGRWGSYVLREAISAALTRSRADPHRVAIGGISMGGFGALDLARIAPQRFCAVGGHSAALWFRGADTPAGAFGDAADFARNDVLRFARGHSPYRSPVWIDVGTEDPFRAADTALARELRADGARVTFHIWPGVHGTSYWHPHLRGYFRFYSNSCGEDTQG